MATQSPVSNSGLIALVGLIIGATVTALVTRAPLDSGRPSEQQVTAQRQPGEVQHVDARMWEDPLAVLSRHQAEEDAARAAAEKRKTVKEDKQANKAKNNEDRSPGVEKLCGSIMDLSPRPTRLLLLPVMVSNARYADTSEQRMRTRYAVQAALAVQHFTPLDFQHIGQLRGEGMLECAGLHPLRAVQAQVRSTEIHRRTNHAVEPASWEGRPNHCSYHGEA